MRTMLIALAAAGSTLALATPALAREGCGPGGHRAYNGRCVPNRGPGYAARGPEVRLVVGNYYHGRGYWDGRRYYQQRYRYHNGWRYR